MASSAHKQQEHVPNMYGATAAPPPTPSALSNNPMSTSTAADTLSRLLHRLPPKLSLPTRRSPSAASPPVVSLSDENPNDRLLSASSEVGYFQVSDHNISSQVANSAESESLSLFELDRNKKETYFPKNWPLGFEPAELEDEEEENDEDGERNGGSFCLDSACSTESTEVSLTSLREFTRAIEKVGLKIIETLARAVGFDNPIGEDPTRFCSLMWISQMGSRGDKPVVSGGLYPYIVGLQYQIREQKYSLLSDWGSAAVSPQVDSVLVTLGDIAQVHNRTLTGFAGYVHVTSWTGPSAGVKGGTYHSVYKAVHLQDTNTLTSPTIEPTTLRSKSTFPSTTAKHSV